MPSKKSLRIPSLRCNENRGFVDLNGKRHYLGPWGADETKQEYDRVIAEWLVNKKLPVVSPNEISISELCLEYWRHSQEYYKLPDGSPTSQLGIVKDVIRPLKRLYGETLACEFGPLSLRTVRNEWMDKGHARTTINKYTAALKRMFRWAASHEKIDISVYQSIETVEGLRKGRTKAKEPEPVKPVKEDYIGAVEPYVSRQVWTMIQLQLLTGARPGEIVQLRACDLDTSDDIWVTRPELHKLAYRGIERAIFFGVKAQALLREFMSTKGVHEYLFSPADAAREQHEDSPTHRRPGQKETSRTTKRRLGERYTTKSYRQAIVRACEKVKDTDAGKSIKLVTWTPNQLRHNAATAIRREFGLEAARQVLGHTKADTTQIYAERDARVVKQVMSEIG